MAHDTPWCPIMQPSRTDFQRPFAEFVAEVFSRDPDLPMFKVCARYVSARHGHAWGRGQQHACGWEALACT